MCLRLQPGFFALPVRFEFLLASAHFMVIRSHSRTCRRYLHVSVSDWSQVSVSDWSQVSVSDWSQVSASDWSQVSVSACCQVSVCRGREVFVSVRSQVSVFRL
ncbi:hypothetical protein MmiHf6_01060 [Methanimicrococcus hongohii]|uniref:Uncharacterized protein n=1 Tax=Methanimicrococcus hongohii TaxID=3028295 RepID=A0AA96ZT65_9EURY|nr:hypothetical protein MmiHf6_01060 [Methanimicrococcus sp. Hf6]